MVLIGDAEEKLQNLLNSLYEERREKGLKINICKTEMIGESKRNESLSVNIKIVGTTTKQLTKCLYLGILKSQDGRCDSEIRARVRMTKAYFLYDKKRLNKPELECTTKREACEDLCILDLECCTNVGVGLKVPQFRRDWKRPECGY